ncbi:MAG: CBO2463/CBO2479 domain-containing protein [Aristaeellaceae bacterium]
MLDYLINPVLMGGLVKSVDGGTVTVHLHGRLGVVTVLRQLVLDPIPLEPGHELQFYFSYLQIRQQPYDYDTSPLRSGEELVSALVGAEVTEVNDTAIAARIQDGLGTVAVPRRWVFTDVPLEKGQTADFYLSPMKVTGKRKIPVRSI